jgi:hypothetical protein
MFFANFVFDKTFLRKLVKFYLNFMVRSGYIRPIAHKIKFAQQILLYTPMPNLIGIHSVLSEMKDKNCCTFPPHCVLIYARDAKNRQKPYKLYHTFLFFSPGSPSLTWLLSNHNRFL